MMVSGGIPTPYWQACRSDPQIPQLCTLSTTSPAPALGVGASINPISFSFLNATAFMIYLFRPPLRLSLSAALCKAEERCADKKPVPAWLTRSCPRSFDYARVAHCAQDDNRGL